MRRVAEMTHTGDAFIAGASIAIRSPTCSSNSRSDRPIDPVSLQEVFILLTSKLHSFLLILLVLSSLLYHPLCSFCVDSINGHPILPTEKWWCGWTIILPTSVNFTEHAASCETGTASFFLFESITHLSIENWRIPKLHNWYIRKGLDTMQQHPDFVWLKVNRHYPLVLDQWHV